MSDDEQQRQVLVGETDDGRNLWLPVVELLTGRGFVTGKSGSGKSNTASVIAEELLEAGFPLLIIDTDGEYYGLKEEYEMLHAGADEECDIQIGPEHAEQMASLALEENVPIILDVSGYLDEDVADELIKKVAQQLFIKEKKLKKPFLLVVEEVHEYIPEGGGVGETGNLLIKISKRGRKHGLGIVGISQRPADVKKDFITQANWLVWHRLTWDNDTKVVGRIIDTEYSELVADLNDGQAFVQTDWTEVDVRKVQFRRKRTFDAGATPGLDDFERPELKSVSDALVGDLEKISERKEQEENRILELENELEKKEKRIETLEDELESARDISNAAKQMADALMRPETYQTQLPDNDDDMRRLHDELVELEDERDELQEALSERNERINTLEAQLESQADAMDRLREENERLRERVAELESPAEVEAETAGDEPAEIVHGDGDTLEYGYADADDDDESELIVAEERDDADGREAPAGTNGAPESTGMVGASGPASIAGSTGPTDTDGTTEPADMEGPTESDSASAAVEESEQSESAYEYEYERGDWPAVSRKRNLDEIDRERDGDDGGSEGADTSTADQVETSAIDRLRDGAAGRDGTSGRDAGSDGASLEGTADRASGSGDWPDPAFETEASRGRITTLANRLETASIADELERASEQSQCSVETARAVLAVLVRAGPLETAPIADRVDRSTVAVQSLISELRTESVLDRTGDRTYKLDDDVRAELVSASSDLQGAEEGGAEPEPEPEAASNSASGSETTAEADPQLRTGPGTRPEQ